MLYSQNLNAKLEKNTMVVCDHTVEEWGAREKVLFSEFSSISTILSLLFGRSEVRRLQEHEGPNRLLGTL